MAQNDMQAFMEKKISDNDAEVFIKLMALLTDMDDGEEYKESLREGLENMIYNATKIKAILEK